KYFLSDRPEHTDCVVSKVGDINIANRIHRQPRRCRESGVGRGATVADITGTRTVGGQLASSSGDGRDDSISGDFADTIIFQLGDIYVAIDVGRNPHVLSE